MLSLSGRDPGAAWLTGAIETLEWHVIQDEVGMNPPSICEFPRSVAWPVLSIKSTLCSLQPISS
jgi:hypothetical protein